MFWAKARSLYSNVDRSTDPDYQTFLRFTAEFQHDVYKGLAGAIQDMGHQWVSRHTPASGNVLEIGFGAGRHARFFSGDKSSYFVCDYDGNFPSTAAWRHLKERAVSCDACMLPYADASFDCVISIYNLEHIQNLDAVFAEVSRVLKPGGRFLVALPCEGGLAWNLGRELTTRRMFQQKYGINYDKVIALEHVWDYGGIIQAARQCKTLKIVKRDYFPFRLPVVDLNIVGCLELERIYF